jgi:hypothetical protein
MSPYDHERDESTAANENGHEDRSRPDPPAAGGPGTDMSWLEEIVALLENDPGECWLAMESLADLDEGTRRAIIVELSDHRSLPGVLALLHLLSAASDPGTRSAARQALAETERPQISPAIDGHVDRPGDSESSGDGSSPTESAPPGVQLQVYSRSETSALEAVGIRIVRGLVTPVDGQGRGTVVVSSSRMGQRRTAAFWCDVRSGILDAVGEVEPDSPSAGRLVDEWINQTGGDCASDVPELAVRLLGGSLHIGGATTPGHVREWVDGMLGTGFQPSGSMGIFPRDDTSSIADEEMAAHAHAVLDACPSWLDRSALTFELAEEIALREGSMAPDPVRDAGAYRYLFEHLLIHRLEMYRRMLLWMAWVWQGSGLPGLSESAFVLACQLSDEQYEVPSHPFTVALSTRSLEAAQELLRTAEDS